MLPVIFGIPALLLLMVSVIGGPILYYTKRDMEFEKTKDQPDRIRLAKWYDK